MLITSGNLLLGEPTGSLYFSHGNGLYFSKDALPHVVGRLHIFSLRTPIAHSHDICVCIATNICIYKQLPWPSPLMAVFF
jgi:hypothetical protein